MSEHRANEVFGGTFLIGLALIFLFGWWWPGILYVIGVALLARAAAQGRSWMDERIGLGALAIAVLFTILDFLRIFGGLFWPVILILIGAYLLLGRGGFPHRGGSSTFDGGEKAKNDDRFV